MGVSGSEREKDTLQQCKEEGSLFWEPELCVQARALLLSCGTGLLTCKLKNKDVLLLTSWHSCEGQR